MIPVHSHEDVETAFGAEKAMVFKNSTRCPISRGACAVMERWLKKSEPDVDVYCIDVIENRTESDLVAKKSGLRHESPQAILLVQGKPVWSASHWNITEDALDGALKGQ